MSASVRGKPLWERLRHRRSLGRIRITFYPPSGEASIAAAPPLHVLARRDWHWLYLQHLAESLAALGEQEATQLLVAARTLAEDFVSSSYWPSLIGEKMPVPVAGAVEIVPERMGGLTLSMEVLGHRGAPPAVRLVRCAPQARERLASSNLVLLVHVMRSAAHPLEQYELFKKITLFAEYCERAHLRRDRATLRGAPLYAVVHADIAGIVAADIAGKALDGLPAEGRRAEPSVSTPPSPRRRPPARRWDPCGVATAVTLLVWFGLVAAAVFPFGDRRVFAPSARSSASRAGAPAPARVPGRRAPASPAPPSPGGPAASAPGTSIALGAPGVTPRLMGTAAARPVASKAASPAIRTADLPRFRVVSGILARVVAESRARILLVNGGDVFVRAGTDDLARLQYGAYRSRVNAEAEAWRLRAQGYTATIIPW